MDMDILKTIERTFNAFHPKERAVALYVVNHPRDVREMKITQLAQVTHTSIATVNRFSQKIGCKSYADFKIQLAVVTTEQRPVPAANSDDTLQQINEFYKHVINKSVERLDEETITQVVAKISQARKIYVYGIGSSGLTAKEFETRLSRMGLTAFACTDSHSMKIAASLLTAKDLVICISISGNTVEVIEAAQLARQQGATIISFTSFQKSKLTETSEITVLVYNALFLNRENFINSQFSLMYLIDVLSVYLLRDPAHAADMAQTISVIHPR
jgi:DNA-binding MurR/RpiR family transcriptional regulator